MAITLVFTAILPLLIVIPLPAENESLALCVVKYKLVPSAKSVVDLDTNLLSMAVLARVTV